MGRSYHGRGHQRSWDAHGEFGFYTFLLLLVMLLLVLLLGLQYYVVVFCLWDVWKNYVLAKNTGFGLWNVCTSSVSVKNTVFGLLGCLQKFCFSKKNTIFLSLGCLHKFCSSKRWQQFPRIWSLRWGWGRTKTWQSEQNNENDYCYILNNNHYFFLQYMLRIPSPEF